MSRLDTFLHAISAEFPDDRLTWQKRLPTFHPESADEAARLFKLAVREKQRLYITGFGNNIDPVGDRFADLVIVRTDRLNAIHEISDADLCVKVGAGYPLRELMLSLTEKKLFLPHASLPYVGSAGGAVAVNLTAKLNGHDLPLKKYFIQSEIVNPQGEVVKLGSICFKSVSGYDVVKIYAPSWGLLGLIVSATFRVMPSTVAEEFATMKMKPVDRDHFLSGLDDSSQDVDVIYSRKIKAKFDPHGILPIV
ncbi:MAG: FAD-binding oxidoreductase [candidate division Zixibacteria bacterium]|nr:FAD-binding oxidoreductase [candidate division Zixibacteria bacterium]